MRTRLAVKIHALLERVFPERRLFLKSDDDTRFIRLRSETQAFVYLGATAVVAWAIVATAVILMDSIGAGNFREQAKRDQQMFQERLNAIAAERDARHAEALAAQARFNAALGQISTMQSELLSNETSRRELATGLSVMQATLSDAMDARDSARQDLAALRRQMDDDDTRVAAAAGPSPIGVLAEVLEGTAQERDRILADAQSALDSRAELEAELKRLHQKNDRIFSQLEEAVTLSIEPIDQMIRGVGMSPDRLLAYIRSAYSGQGGPETPLTFSTRGEEPTEEEMRANRLLTKMDLAKMYRIAAQKVPFASPIQDAVRYTSGFGYRRDPKTGGRRMHNGADFAGPRGTDIFATADGMVKFAGWRSGFGRLIILRHEFGVETYYAHNSTIRVKQGQRVSRGDHIADMGNTGRTTGTHLHYEVRVDGTPVNPMIYIKAANNVLKKQNKRARHEIVER